MGDLQGMQRGMDFMLYGKIKGKWSVIAGQQGATVNMSAETLDRTCKDSGQWREKCTSFKEWSVDGDGIIVFGNEAYEYLRDCFVSSTPVEIAISHTDRGTKATLTNFMKGKAIITEFNHEFGYEDNATYSMTLEGASQLEFASKIDVPTGEESDNKEK